MSEGHRVASQSPDNVDTPISILTETPPEAQRARGPGPGLWPNRPPSQPLPPACDFHKHVIAFLQSLAVESWLGDPTFRKVTLHPFAVIC